MSNNPLSGVNYFFKGFSLIFKPGIRQWVFIPFLINLLLFGSLIYCAWLYFPIISDIVIAQVQSWLPEWTWLIKMIRLLLWPLFVVFTLLVVFLTFTFVGNLIGEPFNGFLATAVEMRLTGKPVHSPSESWFNIIIGFIWKQIGKLFYFLKWAVVLLIISFIPIINIASPVLWFLFSAWLVSLEYADAPLGNHGYKVPEQRKILAQKRILVLGFGSAVLLMMLIPIINFLIMPVAVAGATNMWVREFSDSTLDNDPQI